MRLSDLLMVSKETRKLVKKPKLFTLTVNSRKLVKFFFSAVPSINIISVILDILVAKTLKIVALLLPEFCVCQRGENEDINTI